VVRQKGYAFTCDMVTRGGGIIAMPLPRIAGQPQMVLGIGGISEVMRQREETLATALRSQIERRFGSPFADGLVPSSDVRDALGRQIALARAAAM
jgi:DNA-binding IclR family transcriptional regulator